MEEHISQIATAWTTLFQAHQGSADTEINHRCSIAIQRLSKAYGPSTALDTTGEGDNPAPLIFFRHASQSHRARLDVAEKRAIRRHGVQVGSAGKTA